MVNESNSYDDIAVSLRLTVIVRMLLTWNFVCGYN